MYSKCALNVGNADSIPRRAESSWSPRYTGNLLGPCTAGLSWDVEEVLHKCNIWSRVYSCPSQGRCLQHLCQVCASQIFVGSVIQSHRLWCLLGSGLHWVGMTESCSAGWTVGAGHRQENSLNFTLQGGKVMGHINSPPLNILITFLNTHLVRKGVGWHYISFSFPSASACQFPFQLSSSLSFFSVTPWVHRASPSSSFTSLLCTQKIQQSRGHCPHIAPVPAMSPLQVSAVPICGISGPGGVVQVCVCSAPNAAGIDPPQELPAPMEPSLLLLLLEFVLEEFLLVSFHESNFCWCWLV